MGRPKWQKQFDDMPEWMKKLVRAVAEADGYGLRMPDPPFSKNHCFVLYLPPPADREWWEGFRKMVRFAKAVDTKPLPTLVEADGKEAGIKLTAEEARDALLEQAASEKGYET